MAKSQQASYHLFAWRVNMSGIQPTSGSNPIPDDPNKTGSSDEKTPPALTPANSMTEFMKMFTPEDRKKFMDILARNCSNEINKASKRYIEELRRERQEYE